MAQISSDASVAPVQKQSLAFALSLTGGILILLSGAIGMMWTGGMMGGNQGMMGMMQSMMGDFGFVTMAGYFILSLVSGLVVLLGALLLNSGPQSRYTWGAIIIVFSAVSVLGMGGFLIGALLGIVGGVLALA